MNENANTVNDDLESLVGQAADEYTDRVNRGECVEIEEYAQRYPEIADVLRQMLPSLALMGQLAPPAQGTPSAAGAAAAIPEYLGDYRILRRIGAGGMGIVYEAEQKSLGRRVALKVLPFHRLMDPLYLKRFHREAQAAAGLHHTNIVPVFGVGEHEGIHFYAMQFIAGLPLDRVIRELRRLRQSADRAVSVVKDAGSSAPAPDSASGIARSLCTGQFAAEAGNRPEDTTSGFSSEEHADEADGISSLSDQSFAQYCRSVARLGIQVAEALSHAHGQGILHRDIKPSNLLLDAVGTVWVTDFGLAKAQTTEDLTHTGDLVGTLRYVAPERLSGQSDARSDIFSLGLTLYELLLLRPAYDEKTQEGLVQQVTVAEPPPPRKLEHRIPSDLNTVIQKAIAKEPERRYATALELAGDLQRFLEDRPISARRTSQFELAWRWCRRNPAIAVLSAGFLVALLVGFGGALWQWRSAERQRKHAEANFQKARDAVDECFTTVTENSALQEPGMEGVRHVLFQAALKYYQDFLNERADDVSTQVDLARAYYRLGYITERIGSKTEALSAYENGCALFEMLVASDPLNTQLGRELAQCHESLGELHRVLGRSDQAEAEFMKAIAVREELARRHPNESDLQNELATAYRMAGSLYRTTSRPAQSEASYRRALGVREEIIRAFPRHALYRNALALDRTELSRLLAVSSRPVEAETAMCQAITTMEELTREYPDVSEYQDSLATGYNSLAGFLFNSAGDSKRIEDAYQKALVIREQLARDHPKVQQYRSELARLYNNLALYHYVFDHDDKAGDYYTKALTLREQLARQQPNVIGNQKALAKTHHDLGLLFRRAGRWTDADRSFHQALAIQEQLLARNREISEFAIDVATTVNNLGLIAYDQGNYQASVDWYTRAVRDLSDILKTDPRRTDARNLLGQSYDGRAWNWSELGQHSQALADWDRSLEFVGKMSIFGARLGRAATLAHLGNYPEAVAEADRLTPTKRGGVVHLTSPARVYAAAAVAVARDPKLPSADKQKRAEEFAARSVELLTRGYESGEFHAKPGVATLKLSHDFDGIRSRPDFIRLLQKIDAKDKH
jgi:serine/threonine protein kinase